jgi:drug/metabolite transporter (DMT)-like permease
MQTLLLYASVVLIWGTTWAAIPYQLGEVPVPVSIGYRFIVAALVLYLFAFATRRRLVVPRHAIPVVGVQGLLLFCVNYLFVYHGTAYITSGLVAVVFSLIVLFNALFTRLFFGTAIDARLFVAAIVGTLGIVLLFLPEVRDAGASGGVYVGIALIVAATLSASLGNMAAIVSAKQALPVVAANAHGMLFGGVLSLLLAVGLSQPISFSLEPGYIWSLIYLSIFGSAVAFGAYIALLRRIGAARASYSSVLFPVVALLTSTVLEGYRWSFAAGIGILLTLVGNWLILSNNQNNLTQEKN